jgi:hypothetical protein
MATRARDKQGKAIKTTLTESEFKRLDALFQAKALIVEMQQGQRLLDKFVLEARKHGATWTEIGDAVGISQQSAHQRWSVRNARNPARGVAPARKPRVAIKHEQQERLAV